MKRFNFCVLILFLSLIAQAQDSAPQMADKFREDGKIYIVIAVIAMIFAAIVIFLTLLERKLKKIETRINELDKKQ
jgi:preprotein translocase subunit SecG